MLGIAGRCCSAVSKDLHLVNADIIHDDEQNVRRLAGECSIWVRAMACLGGSSRIGGLAVADSSEDDGDREGRDEVAAHGIPLEPAMTVRARYFSRERLSSNRRTKE